MFYARAEFLFIARRLPLGCRGSSRIAVAAIDRDARIPVPSPSASTLACRIPSVAPIGARNSFLYSCYSVGGKPMSTRRHSRPTARRGHPVPLLRAYSLYRRPLRIERLEDRRLLAVITVNTLSDTNESERWPHIAPRSNLRHEPRAGADTIEFAPALTADGPAKIVLTQGELKITDSLTIELALARACSRSRPARRANLQRG